MPRAKEHAEKARKYPAWYAQLWPGLGPTVELHIAKPVTVQGWTPKPAIRRWVPSTLDQMACRLR